MAEIVSKVGKALGKGAGPVFSGLSLLSDLPEINAKANQAFVQTANSTKNQEKADSAYVQVYAEQGTKKIAKFAFTSLGTSTLAASAGAFVLGIGAAPVVATVATVGVAILGFGLLSDAFDAVDKKARFFEKK